MSSRPYDNSRREYVETVRKLLDLLIRESSSGLIPFEALPLISVVDRMTRTMEKRALDTVREAPHG